MDQAEHAGPHGGQQPGVESRGYLNGGMLQTPTFHEPILIRIKADPNYLDRLN